jgi:signal transduction histidine kinase
MSKMKYRISSRAAILLGRESVSKVDGAVIELIKNTYDADAVLCFLCFDIENDCIYIIDNGIGMTEDLIENCWMMIGTDNKRENYESEKKRIKSGEKGIGRFALDRLGSKCDMYTKNNLSDKLILWRNDWSSFEEVGKTIDEIEADFEYIDISFKDAIPSEVLNSIADLKSKNPDLAFELDTGTFLKISSLRDNWTDKEIDNVISSMGFLIPPSQQKDYIICVQKSLSSPYVIIENEAREEYDYKINAKFDGEKFYIELDRNEFDLVKMPNEIFQMDRFKDSPYRYQDFEKKVIKSEYSISELMLNEEEDYISAIKQIGKFEFNYIFMKMTLQDDSSETFFYKEISKKRKIWLEQYGGIKVYRDNFWVRPYGDPDSDSFDWLGLDARRATNPAAISHPSENWHVRNAQGQGTVLISRIDNESILDKSSREGIIENEYFKLFKRIINNIISIFEKDRAYIGRTMKLYSDIINEKEKTKQTGKELAKNVLNKKGKKKDKSLPATEQVKTLAKAVQYYEEEREELITEVKLLRSLATNGLITTSIVHDLKSINALLVNRVDAFKFAIDLKDEMLITRCLNDLRENDIFLNSWITVITNQSKDKRTRNKRDVYETIKNTIVVLGPILKQKNVNISVLDDSKQVMKKIFVSDFESIIYNLIINSIESFEKSNIPERIINIRMETNTEIVLNYEDNGNGLSDIFKSPYDIFKYGVTSKYDLNGKPMGTGLGMYIVASTVREYNAQYEITKYVAGFGLKLKFPI